VVKIATFAKPETVGGKRIREHRYQDNSTIKTILKKTNTNILRNNLTFLHLFNCNAYFCEIISKQKQLCY
jgi:hypothetical protein